MQYFKSLKFYAYIILFLAPYSISYSGSMVGTVVDQNGNLLENAVITIIGENSTILDNETVMPPPIMNQKNIQFSPFVLPVAAGTTVYFPNKDDVRHHVYSFSKVKRFELELYGGDEEKSVLFDKEGVVALGCNIHDQMLAYIYIARSNKFATTDKDGKIAIGNLDAGKYSAIVWHPRLKGKEDDFSQEISISQNGATNITFEIPLKREKNRKKKSNY